MPAVGPPPKDHVWATSSLVRIYDKPDKDASVIGGFRFGQSIAIRKTSATYPLPQKRLWKCTKGWYGVEPRGYVCVGGQGFATLDSSHPAIAAGALVMPRITEVYPFKFGSAVDKVPRYMRIPTAEEQRAKERDLDNHLANLPASDKDGAVDTTPAGKGPPAELLAYFERAQPPLVSSRRIDELKVSWGAEFDAAGRTWLLTPELEMVPKDKVRVKALPDLKGIDLRKNPDMHLPLAFIWMGDAPKWSRDEQGQFHKSEEKWPRHSFVPATGQRVGRPSGGLWWETRDGKLIWNNQATVITKARRRPGGVGPNDKWVHVRVTWGYMVAYEGDEPVYATAVSPGISGLSNKAHSTKGGMHQVGWKLFSADMYGRDSGKRWWVDEVPWAMYYYQSYALHGAWWHNQFGRPKSHGCVNLTPADAHFMFQWTDPVMPEGWYAVAAYRPHVKGTSVYVTH